MIPVDVVPLYMMIGCSMVMLFFTAAYRARGGAYDAPLARFALMAFYTVVIASVTVFMVSCNFHRVGLSISMCYLFVIMIAPTYRRLDTVVVCILILVSWWLPGQLPYAENYDLFKHFLLRFSIIVGFIVLRSIFLRQSANERHIKEMGHAFIKLADDDRYLFRFGGEEFVAILPDIAEEARRIAGELLAAVRAAAVPRSDLPDKSIVTASFGVACGNSRELSDLSAVAKADKQLYVCKNGGKNCVAASGVIYRRQKRGACRADKGVPDMVESKIYIGLNDVTTNTQLFENEKYIRVLRNVCYSYRVPFSFSMQEGGYIYESGEYARETSLVLTLIDAEKAVVDDIARDLCAFFHQESVLVTESQIQARFVRETLDCGGAGREG